MIAYAVAGGLQCLAGAVVVFGFTDAAAVWRRFRHRPRHAAWLPRHAR